MDVCVSGSSGPAKPLYLLNLLLAELVLLLLIIQEGGELLLLLGHDLLLELLLICLCRLHLEEQEQEDNRDTIMKTLRLISLKFSQLETQVQTLG